MANKKLIYSILVVAALLLLIIPFFLFDIGNKVNGVNHFVRFGLHVLSFFGAVFLGSLFVTGVSNASTAAATVKIVTVSTTAMVTTVVAYNAYQTTKQDFTALNAKNKFPATEQITNFTSDSLVDDSIVALATTDSISTLLIDSNYNSVEPSNNTTPIISDGVKNESASSIAPKKETNNPEKQTTNTSDTKTLLDDICHSFQVIHRAKKLDRKLGLSIYDPDKTIKLLNDCGCIIKEAPLTLTREGAIIESKIQNGNFATLRTFRSLNVDDIVSISITKATCKDSKGNSFLYTFPKPLLLSLIIGDHREFDSEKAIPTKQPKALNGDNEIRPAQKDKIEEEMNKYGN